MIGLNLTDGELRERRTLYIQKLESNEFMYNRSGVSDYIDAIYMYHNAYCVVMTELIRRRHCT